MDFLILLTNSIMLVVPSKSTQIIDQNVIFKLSLIKKFNGFLIFKSEG